MYLSRLKRLFNALLMSATLMSAAFSASVEQIELAKIQNRMSDNSSPYIYGSVSSLLSDAARNGHQNIVTYLLTSPDVPEALLPRQFCVNEALKFAALNGHQNIVAYLLTSPDIPTTLRPTQRGTEHALGFAIIGGRQNIVAYLLTSPDIPTTLRPTQFEVDRALQSAVINGHQNILTYLLTRPDIPTALLPTQTKVNDTLRSATARGDQNIVEYLLTSPDIPTAIRPTQTGVDEALIQAATEGRQDIITYLLSRDIPAAIRPTRAGTVSAYREAVAMNFQPIVSFLEPSVPALERQMQRRGHVTGQGQSLAFEVHDYAATPVSRPESPTTMRLNDAVIEHLHGRMEKYARSAKSNPLSSSLSKENFIIELYKWIDGLYPDQTQNGLAKHAIQHGWDDKTLSRLNLVRAFLDAYHPDSFEIWIKGFIGESIEAYKGRNNSTSCSKGIDERIVTGLRGIGDTELDDIFKMPERNLMIKNFFASLNIGETKGSQRVANALWSLGITTSNTLDQVEAAYRAFLNERIISHGGNVNVYAEQVAQEVRVLEEGNYDSYVKPQIKILEDRALREQQDRQFAAAERKDRIRPEEAAGENPAHTHVIEGGRRAPADDAALPPIERLRELRLQALEKNQSGAPKKSG